MLSDTGGAMIKFYILNYRRQFGEWAESVTVDRRSSSITLDGNITISHNHKMYKYINIHQQDLNVEQSMSFQFLESIRLELEMEVI